jgi:uncharacterized protein
MTATEAVIEAAKAGDVPTLRELLAKEPGLAGTRTESGETLIELALYRGHSQAIEAILDAGKRLDVWEAAALGRLEAVESLLAQNPALVNQFSPGGYFALALAAFFGHKPVFDFLLQRGADIHLVARNNLGVTALHAALANRHIDMAEELIQRGADVNAAQPQGFRPLHTAAFHGMVDMVRMLLANGADPSAQTNESVTPLDLAVQRGHMGIAELLRARSATA